MSSKICRLLVVASLMGGAFAASSINNETELALKAAPAAQASPATVTFNTTGDYPFEDGTTTKTITVDKEALETISIPRFKANNQKSFAGWYLDAIDFGSQEIKNDLAAGNTYPLHRLLRSGFYAGDSATFAATTTMQGTTGSTDIYEVNKGGKRSASIKDLGLSTGKVYVYPDPDGGAGAKSYTLNTAGFSEALYDLYSKGNAATDYTIYVGGTISGTFGTSIGAKTITASGTSDVSFYSLNGKIASLTITGSSADVVNDSPATAVPTSYGLLPFAATANTGLNFGTDVEFRNIRFSGAPNLAANGNSLYLGGGLWGTTATNVYGGSYDGSNVTAKPDSMITVSSTGTGSWNVYGGNNTGTYSGDTKLVINNTSGTITNLVGGSNSGTVTGNTNLTVNDGKTITNIYGGTNTGVVKGNVNTVILTMNSAFRMGSYRGGANSGTIEGSITNFIAGNGGITADYWYGGSSTGKIGTAGSQNVIHTVLDTSLHSQGNIRFIGGNQTSGVINADITNTVRASKTADSGSMYSVNGATGYEGTNLSTISAANMDGAASADARAQIAKNGAAQQTIGNIDTHILGGMVARSGEAGYAHATGMKGYFEGDAVITVGILNGSKEKAGGYNYAYCYSSRNVTDLVYRVSPAQNSTSANRTEDSDWDIFGGTGGSNGTSWGGYTKGNTATVINNALARWTYGGGYSGVIDGNSSHTMNGGLVDTLEGGGYNTQRIYGNTTANMHNGEINFFFSGGGWNDEKIVGNVAAYCTGGYINAPIGGSYGSSSGHTITGNASVTVTGGNFSGMNNPSHGSYRGFSGGVTRNGTIYGDVELTLDLRNSTGFQLPVGTNITGGNPDSGSGNIGTNNTNKITLNIYTAAGENVLNGAKIYGDGGTAARTKSGEININLNAPDSTIGSVFATSYVNRDGSATSGSRKLLRNVNINVRNAAKIGTLTGGNGSENIDNTMYTNSLAAQKGVTVKLGSLDVNPETSVDEQPMQPIAFTDKGLLNFTSLAIQNGTTALASGGDIKNGASATAGNHYNTYEQFGDVVVEDASGFGVTSTNNIISAGKMTIKGEGHVYSAPGKGKINLTDVIFNDGSARLTWHKQDSGTLVSSTGTHFGSVNAYQVLTINPIVNNVSDITPFNFMGIEESTGKTFVGDNDVVKEGSGTGANKNGFGIMIPGAVIDYEVTAPIANGEGDIQHDVTEVKQNNQPLTIDVWATEKAGTSTQKGRMIVPIKNGMPILPEFTFAPETMNTGSWIKNVEIMSTDINDTYSQNIAEQPTSDPAKWKMAANGNEYSYTIKVTYSNKAELAAKNVIITESAAKGLTDIAAVTAVQEAKGRPFMETSLNAAGLSQIKSGLGAAELSKKYSITYSVKDKIASTSNTDSTTVNLVIVKDGSVISAGKTFALYAKDTSLMLYEAQNLADQPTLDVKTLATIIFADDTVDASADLANSYLNTIRGVTTPVILPIKYTATLDNETIEKSVDITVTGAIFISEATDYFNFGIQETSMQEQTHWPTRIDEDIVISDTRGDGKEWTLFVREDKPLTDTAQNLNLSGCLYYQEGSSNTVLSTADIPVEIGSNGSVPGGDYSETFDVTADWADGTKGIRLTVPRTKQINGEYEGQLEWTVTFAP